MGRKNPIHGVNGYKRKFSYGSNGFVSEVRDPLERTITYSYTAQNRIASVTA